MHFGGVGVLLKKTAPQRLERDRLQPLTAIRSCNPRERKNIYGELQFLEEILYLCSETIKAYY